MSEKITKEVIEKLPPEGGVIESTIQPVGEYKMTEEGFGKAIEQGVEKALAELDKKERDKLKAKHADKFVETSTPLADAMWKTKEMGVGKMVPVVKTLDPSLVGTDAAGGYAVPAYVAPDIYKVMGDYGLRNKCRLIQWPMGYGSGTMPSITTKPTMAARLENGATADTRATYGEITVTLYDIGSVYVASQWMVDQNVIRAFEGFINELMGEAQAYAEDNYIINGSGTNQPKGIVNLASVNTVYLGGAADSGMTSIDDIKVRDVGRCEDAVADWTEKGAEFFADKTVINAITGSTDSNNRTVFDPVTRSYQAQGIPLNKHPLVPHVDGAGNTIGIYGNLKNMLFAQQGGMQIKFLDQATIDSVNLAEYNYVGWRFLERVAIVSMNDTAFCLLKTASSGA